MSPAVQQGIGRHPQRGYNLIELMVALALSATLIGAVMMAVSGTGLTGRAQDSMAALSENGQLAANILSTHLRMAGFQRPDSPLGSMDTATPMLFGCDNGFASVTAAFGALACNATAGNDAIAMLYDARETGDAGDTPVDCLGANSTALPNGIADNRFYIAVGESGNPGLFCRGNGGGNGQMLIENVETMQLRYGLASVVNTAGVDLFDPPAYNGQTAQYVNASALAAVCGTTPPTANSWCGVTSVRVCLIVRSEDRTAEAASTPFTDCDGNSTTINDRRLRRAVVTTVSLRNRNAISNPAPVASASPSPTP
ncbi:MAG: PilW family protein [Pseudomonadota bacterium]|nr:PilW family protein [Pseudomonadota bacterium]